MTDSKAPGWVLICAHTIPSFLGQEYFLPEQHVQHSLRYAQYDR